MSLEALSRLLEVITGAIPEGRHLSKSQDGKYVFVESSSKETTEILFVDLSEENTPTAKAVAERRAKVLYDVEHRDGRWFISTNVGGTRDFHLVSSPAVENSAESWEPVVDSSTGERLFDGVSKVFDGITPLKNHAVCYGREEGIPQVSLTDTPK